MRALAWFAAFGALLVSLAVGLERTLPRVEPRFAVAYSAAQARYLGLDARETWRAILRDLEPEHVRLQANWNEVEPEPGVFTFTELDSLLDDAADAQATVTLAVGRKLPRWPECHDPAWVSSLAPGEVVERQLAMVRQVVARYRVNPTIVRWQLENEPLFGYGTCPPPNVRLTRRERDLVRELDPERPILITDSGELSPWLEGAALGDEQGTTLYRVTWDRVVGYFRYPWPPAFYRLKAALVSPLVRQTVVSELQLEPWAPRGLASLSEREAERSFSLEQFWSNVAFVRRLGLPEVFAWGVEWWYAQALAGNSAYWQSAVVLFSPPVKR